MKLTAAGGITVESLMQKVLEFRDQRNWKQYHNPKDLAISLVLEASELLENFQWKTSEQAIQDKKEEIRDELADVMIYILLLSDGLGVDLEEAVLAKIKKNKEKYPVDKAFGSNKKYTDL